MTISPAPGLNLNLAKRSAVVTGGSSGIGRSIAVALAGRDARVVVADIQREPREGGTPTDRLIEDDVRGDAVFVETDVTDPEQIEAAVTTALEWGGLDIMVNNAGIFRSEDFLDVTEDQFDRLMDVNVKGVFFGAQIAARHMVDNGGGSIINLSSVAGLRGSGGFASYCTSKGAIRLLTYAIAEELGPRGIRVNAIHPGLIETEMTEEDVPIVGTNTGEAYLEQIPLRRYGTAGDVAGMVLYLASDLAAYVNGASFVVDGGLSRF
jgi:NAD(P)-dependent dehydrogenase (short-subunit alcohol dehydrogenase family)